MTVRIELSNPRIVDLQSFHLANRTVCRPKEYLSSILQFTDCPAFWTDGSWQFPNRVGCKLDAIFNVPCSIRMKCDDDNDDEGVAA